MRGFLLASSRAGRNACPQPKPTNTRSSARFISGTKLGFIGTPWVSSTPVARLKTSTWSPPMLRAKSARSVRVVTTRALAAWTGSGESAIAAAAIRERGWNRYCFMMNK
jgi:hypothetical protein